MLYNLIRVDDSWFNFMFDTSECFVIICQNKIPQNCRYPCSIYACVSYSVLLYGQIQ